MQLVVHPTTQSRYDFPLLSAMPLFLLIPKNPYTSSILYRNTVEPLRHEAAPLTPSGQPLGRDLVYRVPYHAAQLAEPRLQKVKAAPWTRVTEDDNLVRKLLEVYFIFEFPLLPHFHEDCFLDDMAAGKDRWCSALLLNAVLAAAAVSGSARSFLSSQLESTLMAQHIVAT
jgi:hypothetical protein